ncbi:hypothetical protein MSAN_00126700 [Mycena sanguinolenta]|uniref:Uncharacterized protein n=1 Tax=Mycena sanguinolenta TaxID=230812 RepID=A0A8H7DMY1_9AGAR|nr:hypothetical protein MSAN_00126700 [Mycena sanguinolenta]
MVIEIPILRQYLFMRTALSPVFYLTCHKNHDFWEAFTHICAALQPPFWFAHWIRRSTGRLCTELAPASDNLHHQLNLSHFPSLSGTYPLSARAEIITTFIDSLTIEQYHNICNYNLAQYRHFDLSLSTTTKLGTLFHCPNNRLDSIEIAFLPNAEAPRLGDWTTSQGGPGEVMPNGWTRFQSSDVFNNALYFTLTMYRDTNRNSWLSQANHIFRRLRIMSNFEHYDGEHFGADVDSDYNSADTEDYETAYPPTSASNDSDQDIDAQVSHPQEDVHDPAGRSGGSEHKQKSNCEEHDASESTVEEDMVSEKIFAPSRSLNVLMGIQLTAILVLGLSWLFDHVAVSLV